jgi:hypothetical protein
MYSKNYYRSLQKKLWVDEYGREYSLKDMSMQHIYRCIQLIKSRKDWRRSWLPLLEAEYESRKIKNR